MSNKYRFSSPLRLGWMGAREGELRLCARSRNLKIPFDDAISLAHSPARELFLPSSRPVSFSPSIIKAGFYIFCNYIASRDQSNQSMAGSQYFPRWKLERRDRSAMWMRETRLPSKQIVSCSKNVSKAQKDYGCSCSKKINCAELLRLRITADVNLFSPGTFIQRRLA